MSEDNSTMQQLSARGYAATTLVVNAVMKSTSSFPFLLPGSLTHILKPMEQAPVPITTIASAPSNPSNDVSGFKHKIPELFYSPDFDTSAFQVNVSTYAVRLPASQCNSIMSACKNANILLNIDRVRAIVDDIETVPIPIPLNYASTSKPVASDDGVIYKRVILSTEVKPDALPSELPALIAQYKGQVVPQQLCFNYDYFTADQVLTAILPRDVVIPAGFAIVGHIAHINLRDEQLPYKYAIGKVLIDKNASVETEVNKVGMIDNIYRNFKAEILHGNPSLVTRVKEHNTVYEFDFSEVYWNSRLHTEHSRIVGFMCDIIPGFESSTSKSQKGRHNVKNEESKKTPKPAATVAPIPPLVLDLFAGIGPFTVPAAQRKCVVYGNDLNPRSSLYMHNNTILNKVSSYLSVFNACGRKMLQGVARQQMLQVIANQQNNQAFSIHDNPTQFYRKSKSISTGHYIPWFEHTIMNLPATAVEFLDMYTGLYKSQNILDLPELPPMLNPEHAKIITEMPVTDVLHNCDDLNRLAREQGSEQSMGLKAMLNDGSIVEVKIEGDENIIMSPSYTDMTQQGFKFPIVHCYCFARNINDAHGDALNQAERNLGYRIAINQVEGESMFYDNIPQVPATKTKPVDAALPAYYSSQYMLDQINTHGIYIYHVRNVAPNKEMMCISFRLREDIMFALDSPYKGKLTTTPTLLLENANDTVESSIENKKRASDEEDNENNKKAKFQ